MNKLIKPKNMNAILSRGIVLHSKKQYNNLFNKGFPWNCNNRCAARNRKNLTLTAAIRNPRKYQYSPIEFDCTDIAYCRECFLNARNYLNILKYIKHYGKKRMD